MTDKRTQAMRRYCADCGRGIYDADGRPSIRDRCIPCGAKAGSPWLRGLARLDEGGE